MSERPRDGGFGPHVTVPARSVIPLPAGLAFDEAVLAEPADHEGLDDALLAAMRRGYTVEDYLRLVERARDQLADVATGRFGAHMKVGLVNDGPVTFWLQVPPAA